MSLLEQKKASWLAGLNENQRKAVESVDGPMLILAGAGTGKTKTLTARLAHILALGLAPRWGILAVTFTNKAAREMADRARLLTGTEEAMPWLGTFHAMAARFLRRHAREADLAPDFAILDAADSRRLIRQIIAATPSGYSADHTRKYARIISRWKDQGIAPDDAAAQTGGYNNDAKKAARLYALYQHELKRINAADFGDLLFESVRLLEADSALREDWRARFSYILVDEYQDTNNVQYRWLKALCGGAHNICCVGDDDQSIYGWRGAELGNILRFERDFPGAQIIRLEQNYRSQGHILSAAGSLVARNDTRLGKKLWTAEGKGQPIRLQLANDGEDEARQTAASIRRTHGQDISWRDMAILVRTRQQMPVLERGLVHSDIPYRIIGGLRFYERAEIKDILAYLRLIQNGGDDLAFERAVAAPRRGIGDKALSHLRALAQRRGISLGAAAGLDAEVLRAAGIGAAAVKSLAAFIAQIKAWRGEIENLPPAELARLVLRQSGLRSLWEKQQDDANSAEALEQKARLENLDELSRIMEDSGDETLAEYLESAALMNDGDSAAVPDRVHLMTIHAAKGLEFKAVFLPGWEEGLLPHINALREGEVEEERRLAHVALTRAREQIWIFYARTRAQWSYGSPSRFLREIPDKDFHRDTERTPPRKNVRTPVFDQRAASPRQTAKKVWRKGERVGHGDFGEGTIAGVEGNKLTIDFDMEGRQKIIARYVTKVS